MSAASGAAAALLKYKVLAVDGGAEYVDCGNVANLSFERTDSFSLSIWVKWTADSSLGSVISKLPASAPSRGYDVYIASGVVGFSLSSDSSNRISVATAASAADSVRYNDGRWHHIVVTYAGTSLASGCAIYVDGCARALYIAQNTLSSTSVGTAAFTIGARVGINSVIAQLQDCAVYSKALSAAEVTAIYNSRCPPDLTSVGPTGNLLGYWLLGEHLGDTSLAAFKASYPAVPAVVGANGIMTNMETTDVIARSGPASLVLANALSATLINNEGKSLVQG